MYRLGAGPGYVPDLREKDTGSTFVTFYAGAPTGVIRSWFLEYIPLCKAFSFYVNVELKMNLVSHLDILQICGIHCTEVHDA